MFNAFHFAPSTLPTWPVGQENSQQELSINSTKTALTEGNARVLLPHGVTLFVGKEHVGGQTTLGRIGV